MQLSGKVALVVVLVSLLSACDLFRHDSHSKSRRSVTPQVNQPPVVDPPSSPASGGCQQPDAQTDSRCDYTLFESGHVRPLALSPDGQRLYVVNTPNNSLEVYATDAALTPIASIAVGMEPVAVAAPTNDEVWVVNQLSDSVSVVDVSATPRVKATLLVGDEPRDIVFAGANRQRAFITAAYRGQNHPLFDSADLRESGHGRADVWVFDRTALGSAVGGTPVTIVNLFADTPRALAVSNDGATVYAAAFMSGNQTTVIDEFATATDLASIEIGYFENSAGGDLTINQAIELISRQLNINPRSIFPGLNDAQLLEQGVSYGYLRRVNGKIVKPYFNTDQYRINSSGQVINQTTHSILAVAMPAGTRLVALAGLPPPAVVRSKPAPVSNSEGVIEPRTGLIVKYDGSKWRDEAGTDWSDKIPFSLPDYDVFAIDAMAAVPAERARFAHVGTTLFNMAVNPASGALYISNLDARNNVRFEGPGHSSSTVRGNIAQSRISIISGSTVFARNLNKHLTHGEAQGDSIAAADKAASLSQPMQMAVSADGSTLYVAAIGSSKIGVFDTQELEQDSFVPDASDRIDLPASGPTGVILNTAGDRLYVSTRFNNSVSSIDVASRQIVATQAMSTPEPQSIVAGRRFLYDADLSSSNGESACSTCHVFGDVDALSWDLGDPEETLLAKPINVESAAIFPISSQFHPMKGPMSTQTLRGIADHGPMHWRGDRTGDDPAIINGVVESRQAAAFKAFNSAYVTLLGREAELDEAQMQQFTDFALRIMPPPNPVRALDNSLNTSQQRGRDLYMTASTTLLVGQCNNCHEVDASKQHFGSDTTVTGEGGRVSQDFKVPQLRNLYQKVGRFDEAGEQIRGYGFLHDGSEPTLLKFFHSSVFTFSSDDDRNRVSDFVFAMDSNFAPIVGQQVTVNAVNGEAAQARLDLLGARAQAGECDLVVSAVVNGAPLLGHALDATRFAMAGGTELSRQQLLRDSLPATFTCYPPGNSRRLFR